MKILNSLKVYSLLIPVFLIMATSCQHSVKKLRDPSGSDTIDTASDTLKWQTHTIIKKDEDCDSSRNKTCIIADISYPVFEGHPVLNDSVQHKLMSMIFTERPDSSLEQQVDRFMKDYKQFKKEPYANGRQYELQASAKILRQTPRLVTLQADGYSYTGGAHGMSFTWYINYDRKNKKELKLEDVLKPGFRDSLNSIAGRIFRKNEGLATSGPLPENQYFFKDNQFSLSNNYLFTTEGIQFLYNPYEIKPYAAGQTKLVVPYSIITSLIRDRSIIP